MKLATKMHNWLMVVTICSLSTTEVYGFPNTVGNCAAGTEALLQTNGVVVDVQTHGILNQVGGGPISAFNLSLELDGQVLDPETPFDFDIREDYTLSLIAGGVAFTGFLIRMDSVDDTRTLDSLLPIEMTIPDTNETTTGGVQVANKCQQVEFVAGVSHMDPEMKQQVDVNLNMEVPSQGLVLDVTVVIETSIARNISHWYYSQYTLNAVRPEDEPTAAPITPGPTPAPTPVPTPAPAVEEDVSEEPSASPTVSKDDVSSGSTMAFRTDVVAVAVTVAWLIPSLIAFGTMY